MKKIFVFLIVFFWGSAHAQCPTFTISAPQGTVIGCNPSSVILSASNTSSLSNVTYTWISVSTGTSTGATINGTAPSGSNTYTVLASSPSSTCIASQQISLSTNLVAPSVSVSPISSTMTCNGPPNIFTAVSSSTVGVLGQWLNPGGSPYNNLSPSPLVLTANSPGTYTVNFINISNGCVTSQAVTVFASTVIPTLSVKSSMGYTLSCLTVCLNLSITTTSSVAPLSYSWTNVATSITTTPANGVYAACTPGIYIASFRDGFSCDVTQTVNVVSTCTGIENELNLDNGILVFPNPTTGQVKISGIDMGEVYIFDVFGRVVKNITMEEDEKDLDLSALPSGIYYLQISQPSGRLVKKVIKN